MTAIDEPTKGAKSERGESAAPAAGAPATSDLNALTWAWLNLLRASGRATPSTVRAYEADLRQLSEFLQAAGHSTRLTEIAAADIARFRDSRPNWSASTVKRKLAAVSRFLDWAVEMGLLVTNPARSVARPKARDASCSRRAPERRSTIGVCGVCYPGS